MFPYLLQLLTSRVQEISPPADEQSVMRKLCSKVVTVVQNLILTGEGEELV